MADHKKENLEKENLEKEKQMDEMLDSLLANYSSAGPRPGLETRILARLADAPGREALPTAWNLRWLWAGAAVAAAIVVALVLIGGRSKVKAPVVVTNPSAPVLPHTPQPGLPVTTTAHPERHRPKATVSPGVESTRLENASLPLNRRPEVFPTPTPLSEQERLMFSYLENTPREVVIAQIPRNDDQQESEAFWADREPSSGTRRSTNTR
jgi:hypothetical protein